jgi:SNF2 family DNA or RNA helicase
VSTYINFLTNTPTKWKIENALIIVDESHNFWSFDSSGTQKLLKITNKAKAVLLLSATPIQNNIQDFMI